MPFRESFACLWCGRAHTVRDPSDLEGWAQVCPECIGRAGDNGFLRFRLKAALAERAKASAPAAGPTPGPASGSAPERANSVADAPGPGAGSTPAATGPVATVFAGPSVAAPPATGPASARVSAASERPLHDEMLAYYAARAPEYDDFYLRRGSYERGPLHDLPWQSELEFASSWLMAQPISGEIVELAAGTGWWSPLLAQKGELWAYDAAEAPLDRARDRLLAHNLRAHLHIRDAWAEPDRQVDAVFAGFWLSHVARIDLDAFLALVRRWLKPGGTFTFIDSRRDPQGLPAHARPEPVPGVQLRTIRDGREFKVVKVFYEPDELESALRAAGFATAEVITTSRFFLLGRAVAG